MVTYENRGDSRFPIPVCDPGVCCMFVCGMKPSRKVTCVNTEESIMKGHMHEHRPLYTRVPFVMFDEGGWVGGWWCGGVGVVVASVCPSSGQTHRTSIPTVVVSLTTHDNMYVYIFVHGHMDEHGFLEMWIF